MEKREIRARIAKERESRPADELARKSECICERILRLPEFNRADTVYVYLDTQGEVSTEALIKEAWRQEKRVAAPRVSGDDMAFCFIRSFEDLERGSFGIREPSADCPAAEEEQALVIVPGVGYDCTRSRCGHGKGYYDRYLGRHTSHVTIAPAFEFQIFDQIPASPFDVRPQILITEERLFS